MLPWNPLLEIPTFRDMVYGREPYQVENKHEFDSVSDYPSLKPYFDSIGRGQKISKVLYNYVKEHLSSKVFDVKIEHQLHKINIFGSLRCEVYQPLVNLPIDERRIVAKRMLIALSQTQEIPHSPRRTGFVEPEKGKHEGTLFAYCIKALPDAEDGHKFTALAELNFNPDNNQKKLYQMNVKGSYTFKGRVKKLAGLFTFDGAELSYIEREFNLS